MLPHSPRSCCYPITFQVAVFTTSALCMLVVFLTAIVVVLFRSHPVIKAASYRLCVLMLCACMALAVGAMLYAVSPESGSWVCLTRQVFVGVPTVLFMVGEGWQ